MFHSKVLCVEKQNLANSKTYKDTEHMAALCHQQGICLGIFTIVPVVNEGKKKIKNKIKKKIIY